MQVVYDFFVNSINAIIDWVLGLVNFLLDGLASLLAPWLAEQGMTIAFPTQVFEIINEITLGIGYILPVSALLPIVTFWLGFYVAKIVFAVFSLIVSTTFKRVKVK